MTIKTILNEYDDYFTQCSIVNHDGSVLTSSGECAFSEEELIKIFILFTQTEIPIGTTIERQKDKYLVINSTRKRLIARRYNSGVIAFRCKTFFIVAYHNDLIDTGVCYNAIEKIGQCLENKGF